MVAFIKRRKDFRNLYDNGGYGITLYDEVHVHE